METIREIDLSDWFDWADDGETGQIIQSTYQNNNRTALVIRSENGQPVTDLTVNLPGQPLDDDEIVVNDVAENDGILEPMIEEGIVSEPNRTVQSGFNEYPVCEYTAEQQTESTDESSNPETSMGH